MSYAGTATFLGSTLPFFMNLLCNSPIVGRAGGPFSYFVLLFRWTCLYVLVSMRHDTHCTRCVLTQDMLTQNGHTNPCYWRFTSACALTNKRMKKIIYFNIQWHTYLNTQWHSARVACSVIAIKLSPLVASSSNSRRKLVTATGFSEVKRPTAVSSVESDVLVVQSVYDP